MSGTKFSVVSGVRVKAMDAIREGKLATIGATFKIGERAMVVAECDCGSVCVVGRKDIASGHTQSCGCRKTDIARHGMEGTPEYVAWYHMKARCLNKNCAAYGDYGMRGIRVCDEWLDFVGFFRDMGPRPSALHSLDRINNSGNYEPGNCRWATRSIQQNNTRWNVMYTFYGMTKSVSEWSRISLVSRDTIAGRLRKGWPPRLAVWAPPGYRRELPATEGAT